ncbi:MAG: hypothetical protein QOG72_2273 [Sphingomonadales bacterium]|nr:hypothetical protein [Sphingomonadales bacterium]
MSKRNTSDSSKVAEEGKPFLPPPPEFDEDEPVELDDDFFKHAGIRRGNVVIREPTGRLTREGVVPYSPAEKGPSLRARRGRPPKPEDERKELVSLRLSPEVLSWFRASGPGWQSRIDELLRSHVDAARCAD